MHKYLKIIMFVAGAFAGIVALLGLQKLGSFETIATLLDDQEASAVVRNYGLLALGLVGIVTAMIRLSLADTQQRQDKRSDLFDRFQRSSEMLGSDNIAIRQAGLYTLAEIAREQPDEFYINVQSLFCGFLRNASEEQRDTFPGSKPRKNKYFSLKVDWPPPRADMHDALKLFTKMRTVVRKRESIEHKEGFKPDMTGLFIPGYNLDKFDFSGCDLDDSVFSDAQILKTSFKGSSLRGAVFDRAAMIECDLSNIYYGDLFLRWTRFDNCMISGTRDGQTFVAGTAAIGLIGPQSAFPGELSRVPGTSDRRGFPHFNDFEKQHTAWMKASADERDEMRQSVE